MKLKFYFLDKSEYTASNVNWWMEVPEEDVVIYQTKKKSDNGVLEFDSVIRVRRSELMAVAIKDQGALTIKPLNKNCIKVSMDFIFSDGVTDEYYAAYLNKF